MKAAIKADRVFKKVENESFEVLRVLRDKLDLEMEFRQTYPNYKKETFAELAKDKSIK